MVCAFTGHRPEKLPWKTDEQDPRCLALKAVLGQRLQSLYDSGCRTFLCGMARGCDTYFAEAVVRLRQRWADVRLIAYPGCGGQENRWPEDDRARYTALLQQCDEIVMTDVAYAHGCMLRRNAAMIRRADCLLSVYDGSGGGTGHTVSLARQKGIPIESVWL